MFKGLLSVKTKVAATEAVLDLSDAALFSDVDMSAYENALSAVESLADTLDKKAEAQSMFLASVEKFGADAGLLDYGFKSGVFSNTALTTGATESLIESDPEAALESVLTAALEEEKVDAGEAVTKGSSAIQNAIEKLKELSGKVLEKIKTAGNKVKDTAKAHPYATAAAAVAAIAASTAVVLAVTGKLAPAEVSKVSSPSSWKDAVLKPIRDFKAGVGEKVSYTVFDEAGKKVSEGAGRAQTINGAAGKAGAWTVGKVDALGRGLSAAVSKLTAALGSLGAATKRASATPVGAISGTVGKDVAVVAPKKMGLGRAALIATAVAAVVSGVVGTVLMLIKKIGKSVEVVTEGGEEPAAA